jgi:hypothetical protein
MPVTVGRLRQVRTVFPARPGPGAEQSRIGPAFPEGEKDGQDVVFNPRVRVEEKQEVPPGVPRPQVASGGEPEIGSRAHGGHGHIWVVPAKGLEALPGGLVRRVVHHHDLGLGRNHRAIGQGGQTGLDGALVAVGHDDHGDQGGGRHDVLALVPRPWSGSPHNLGCRKTPPRHSRSAFLVSGPRNSCPRILTTCFS